MDQFLEQNKILLKKKFQIVEKFFDFSFTPLVQSGGEYSLKPTAESSQKALSFDVILLTVAGWYFDYNTNICRTLLINPSKQEQDYYLVLVSLFDEIAKNLRPGSTIADSLSKSLENFKRKNAALVAHLP